MEFSKISERLSRRFPEVKGETPAKGEPFVIIPAGRLPEIAAFLRDDPELSMGYLNSISGVDFPDRGQIEVVYHVSSLKHRHKLAAKVSLARDHPSAPTVERVWPAANWHERECWDLFGVRFEGLSDHRRILLPDDWEGHPLRKDYKVQEYWHGIKVETDH